MKIKYEINGPLKIRKGLSKSGELEIEKNTDVYTVLTDEFEIKREWIKFVKSFVNEEEVDEEYKLKENDILTILTVVGGG